MLVLPASDAFAAETLTVTFSTTPGPNPNYAPRNIVAVWVETAAGGFVKTIGRWANKRRLEMTTWVGAAGVGDTDAVMGATRTSHNGTLTAVWDMTQRGGGVAPDGAYKIRFESADRNSGASSNLFSVDFNKNGTASNNSTSGGGFNNVTLVYTGRTTPPPPPPSDAPVGPSDSGVSPADTGVVIPPDGALPADQGASSGDGGLNANVPVEGCRCDAAADSARGATGSLVLLLLLGLLWLSTRYASARRRRCSCRAPRCAP
ncbi:MAG: DUF2271 domain-containing protein [Myxococcales bacterium]|nr:DUF2271 domain-containing protein [Myxococcales bacterium]